MQVPWSGTFEELVQSSVDKTFRAEYFIDVAMLSKPFDKFRLIYAMPAQSSALVEAWRVLTIFVIAAGPGFVGLWFLIG